MTSETLPNCPVCGEGRPRQIGQHRAIYTAHMHLECTKCHYRITRAYMAGSERKAREELRKEWIAQAEKKNSEKITG